MAHFSLHLDDARLSDALAALQTQGHRIMATLQEVKNELVQVRASIAAQQTATQALKDEITALKDQVAHGGVVSQTQLDELDSQVDDIIVLQSGGTPPPDPGV